MSWNTVRQQLENQLRWAISKGDGLEAVCKWDGTLGTVEARHAETMEVILTVHVDHHDGASFVGVAKADEDFLDGFPWNAVTGVSARERLFRINNRDSRALHKMLHAVGAEVSTYQMRLESKNAGIATDALAPVIQDLVERRPSSVGEDVAGLLGKMLKAPDLERLREALEGLSASPRP